MHRNLTTAPSVSVYMATKNRASILKRAIDSVLNQDYQNIELVVVDDASTDNTAQLLSEYQQREHKFKFVSNKECVGVAAARNIAIRNCSGDFLTGLDDDDYFLPNRISSLLNAYSDEYAFVCSAIIWDWGERQKIADGRAMSFGLRQQLSYNHATTQVFVRRDRMLAIGCFDECFVARIDYDAWTRLVEEYGRGKRISVPSYVLTRDDTVSRVTDSNRNILGNDQYLRKHQHKMNWRNIKNQQFWDLFARREVLTMFELTKQVFAGLPLFKLKYFVKYWIGRLGLF